VIEASQKHAANIIRRRKKKKRRQQKMNRTATLTLAFFHPLEDDPWINRMTALVSRNDVCHAELVFDNGGPQTQAFSIQHGTTASLRAKTLSNPAYELVTLNVSGQELAACKEFCANASKQEYGFDDVGMALSILNPGCCGRSSAQTSKTFCSKIITEAMQFAEMQEVQRLHPSSTTPSMLLDAVRDSSRRVCHSVPSRMRMLKL